MAACQVETADDRTTAPPGYRPVDLSGLGDRRWVHEQTGLAVDLFRYARYRTARQTGVPDHYEHRLVIRPDGPDGRGVHVDSTTEPSYAVPMAAQWMREHPDGVFDGGVD